RRRPLAESETPASRAACACARRDPAAESWPPRAKEAHASIASGAACVADSPAPASKRAGGEPPRSPAPASKVANTSGIGDQIRESDDDRADAEGHLVM